jgi:hypothetical protein
MLRAGDSFGVHRRTLQSDVVLLLPASLFVREVNRAYSFPNDM